MRKKSLVNSNRLSRLQLNYATDGRKGKRRVIKKDEENEETQTELGSVGQEAETRTYWTSHPVEEEGHVERDTCSLMTGKAYSVKNRRIGRSAPPRGSGIDAGIGAGACASAGADACASAGADADISRLREKTGGNMSTQQKRMKGDRLSKRSLALMSSSSDPTPSYHPFFSDKERGRGQSKGVAELTDTIIPPMNYMSIPILQIKDKRSIIISRSKTLSMYHIQRLPFLTSPQPRILPLKLASVGRVARIASVGTKMGSGAFDTASAFQPMAGPTAIAGGGKAGGYGRARIPPVTISRSIPTGRNTASVRKFPLIEGTHGALQRHPTSLRTRTRDASNINDCLIDRTRKIIMSYTPRASCTLAVSLFVHHMGLYREAKIISDWIHNYRLNVLEKKPQFMATIRDWENSQMIRIKVVRNPYYRAVSSYTHFIRAVGSSNQSFEEYLSSIMQKKADNLNAHELSVREYHSKPQRTRFDHLVNHIIKVENIGEELKLVDYRYNTTLHQSYLEVKKSNSHIMTKNYKIKEFVGFHRAEFFRLPNREFNIPDYKHFYNRRIRQLVEEIYGDDIKYFGYAYPWEDPVPVIVHSQ